LPTGASSSFVGRWNTKRGGQVVVADRSFASRKTCSACGKVQEKLPLSVRAWACPVCGTSHDRDLKAARTLLAAGLVVFDGPSARFAGFEAVERKALDAPARVR